MRWAPSIIITTWVFNVWNQWCTWMCRTLSVYHDWRSSWPHLSFYWFICAYYILLKVVSCRHLSQLYVGPAAIPLVLQKCWFLIRCRKFESGCRCWHHKVASKKWKHGCQFFYLIKLFKFWNWKKITEDGDRIAYFSSLNILISPLYHPGIL